MQKDTGLVNVLALSGFFLIFSLLQGVECTFRVSRDLTETPFTSNFGVAGHKVPGLLYLPVLLQAFFLTNISSASMLPNIFCQTFLHLCSLYPPPPPIHIFFFPSPHSISPVPSCFFPLHPFLSLPPFVIPFPRLSSPPLLPFSFLFSPFLLIPQYQC